MRYLLPLLLFALPAAAQEVTMSVPFVNRSGYPVEIRFFRPAKQQFTPIATVPSGRRARIEVECIPGETICWGGNLTGTGRPIGMGLEFLQQCQQCCQTCHIGEGTGATLYDGPR